MIPLTETFHSSSNFFGVDDENFITAWYSLGLSEDNNDFFSFLCSDHGQYILTENSLSIYKKVET